MSSGSFFKGLSLLMLLNLLVKPAWVFLIDRQVQNIVGNETYGHYFALLNLSLVLIFLADAGITNMVNQRIANKTPVNFRQLLYVKLTMLLLYCTVCLFTGWLTHIREKQLLWLVIAVQAITSFYTFLRSIITANQFFSVDAWFSVMDKLLMIVLCSGFIYSSWFGAIDMTIFLTLQIACSLVAVLSALFFIVKNKLLAFHNKMNSEQLIRLLLPFAMIILLMSVHNRLDGFLLERTFLQGPLETGIYASAFRLLDVANMAGYLGASFLVPFIARNQNNRPLIYKTTVYVRNALLLISFAVVSFTCFFAGWMQQVLYHSNNEYHSLIIVLCLLALPAYYLIHVYGSVLTATARLRKFNTCLLFSVLINITLNLLLIPSYGAKGCCIAALASEYFCAIGCFLEARKI